MITPQLQELVAEETETTKQIRRHERFVARSDKKATLSRLRVEKQQSRVDRHLREQRTISSRRRIYQHDVEVDSFFSLMKVGLVLTNARCPKSPQRSNPQNPTRPCVASSSSPYGTPDQNDGPISPQVAGGPDRPLFAVFVIDVNTKQVVHVAVTREASERWTAQPLRQITPFGTGPRFIIRDRDAKFGTDFDRTAKVAGIRFPKPAEPEPKRALAVSGQESAESGVSRLTADSIVPSNVAEGCGREGERELARFFSVAAGSASETEYQLLLARDWGYLSPGAHRQFDAQVRELRRMLASFMQKLTADG